MNPIRGWLFATRALADIRSWYRLNFCRKRKLLLSKLDSSPNMMPFFLFIYLSTFHKSLCNLKSSRSGSPVSLQSVWHQQFMFNTEIANWGISALCETFETFETLVICGKSQNLITCALPNCHFDFLSLLYMSERTSVSCFFPFIPLREKITWCVFPININSLY